MRSGEAVAYYESCGGSASYEPLIEHLRGVGDVVLGSVDAPLGRLLRRRHGLGGGFIECLALGAYLHDIGKAVIRSRYRDREGCVRYSFRGHEAISAYVLSLITPGLDCGPGNAYYAPVFAVLYHHHAMGTAKRVILKPDYVERIEPQVAGHEELSELMASAIKPLPKRVRAAVEEVAPEAAELAIKNPVAIFRHVSSNLGRDLWEAAAGWAGGFAVFTASTAAVVAADYLVAGSARKAPISGFARAALGFARYYLGVVP